MATRAQRILFTVILLLLPFAFLAFLEGGASWLLFIRTLRHKDIAEESHTDPDTLVGWINRPSFGAPDLYAKGVGSHFNKQRVRGSVDLSPEPAAGKRRLVCSGDSFTLGYGVNDAEAYCAVLSSLDPTIESVNMGQGAYGVDQSYLWYVRDGLPLKPSVHLFAVATADIPRLNQNSFVGFPKPQLKIAGDTVSMVGVPLHKPGTGPVMSKLAGAIKTLKLYELMNISGAGRGAAGDTVKRDSALFELTRATLRSLARKDSAAHVDLTVIYQPIVDDYRKHASDKWRAWLHDAAARDGFKFVDLVERLRTVPSDSVDALFIPEGQSRFRGAIGHYSVKGNQWVAAQLRAMVPALSPMPPTPARK